MGSEHFKPGWFSLCGIANILIFVLCGLFMILDHFSEITMRKIDCVSFQIVMLSNCTDLLYSVTPNVQEQLSHLIGNHNYSELRKIDEKIDFNRISVENNPKKHSHFALALPSGCASSSWKCLVPGLLYVLLFAPAQKLKGHLTFRCVA